MPLANAKEFRAAGFKREDTTIALVWCKPLSKDPDDLNCVIVYSEVRCELADARPQDEWEPCAYYRFDGTSIFEQGGADNPLAAIEAASKITLPTATE